MGKFLVLLVLILSAACAARPAAVPTEPKAPPPAPVQPAPAPEAPAGKPEPALPSKTDTTGAPVRPAEKQPVPPPSTPSAQPTPAPAAPEIAMGERPAVEPGQELPLTDEKLRRLIALAEQNDERLLEVFVGMYRKTVEGIMGFSRQNPYKREVISGMDGREYEVLFYLTREPRKGKGVTERQLTPVIIRDDRAVAIGRYPLKKLRRTGTLGKIKLPPPETVPAPEPAPTPAP